MNIRNVIFAVSIMTASSSGVTGVLADVTGKCDKTIAVQAPLRDEDIHQAVIIFLDHNPSICNANQGGRMISWNVRGSRENVSIIQIGGPYYRLTRNNDGTYIVSNISNITPRTQKEAWDRITTP